MSFSDIICLKFYIMKYTLTVIVALCLFATHCQGQSKKSNVSVQAKSSWADDDTKFYFYEVWQFIEKRGSPYRFYRKQQRDSTTEYVFKYNEFYSFITMKFGRSGDSLLCGDGLLLCSQNDAEDLVLLFSGRAFYLNPSTRSIRPEEDVYGVQQLFKLMVQFAKE